MKPVDRNQRAHDSIEHSQHKIGRKLAEHDFHGGDGSRDQLLHCAALPLARDGERGEERADDGHDQSQHPRNDEGAAFKVFVVPSASVDAHGSRWHRKAALAEPIHLNLRRIALNNRLRIANEHISRVVIGAIDKRLHLNGATVAQALREVPRNDDAHLCAAVVEGARQLGITADDAGNMKIFTGLEVFEKVLALLAAVAVVDKNGQSLEVEIDAVAEEQHKHCGHDDDDDEAARIADNLHDLFHGNGEQASEAHGLCSSAASRPVVSETKTSSRLGRILSMRVTAMWRSAR